MTRTVTAYVGLGANLGNAAQTLRLAITAIKNLPQCSLTGVSSFYATKPLETLPGYACGSDYTNAVLRVQTQLCAPVLLQHLHAIEQTAGRQRSYTNAPRTLDLDLLLYGTGHIDSRQLTVPHPRMWQRAFVVVPLAEIAPELVTETALDAVRLQVVSKL